MLQFNSIIPSLKIEKVVFKGLGLGHYQGHTIFVYQGLPGDDVEVKIIHKRSNVYFAEIFSYNSRSPLQIAVKCEVFKYCGGCDWLHLEYENQLKFKEEITKNFFKEFIDNGAAFEKIEPSPQIDFYRNKVFLPVAQDNYGKLYAGIYSRRSHDVVPLQKCFLQPQIATEVIHYLIKLLNDAKVKAFDEKTKQGTLRHIGIRYSDAEGKLLVIIVTKSRKLPFTKIITDKLIEKFPQVIGVIQNINPSSGNAILGDEYRVLFGTEYLTERIGIVKYRTHYSSFFQVNTPLTHLILKYLSQFVDENEVLIDAYSGIGTIGVYLAKKVNQVIFLENHNRSVLDGIENCRINRVKNFSYMEGDVEENLQHALKTPFVSTVVLDPPRKGVDKRVIEILVNSPINKILYMSCDISTQKRDLDLLTEGGFKVLNIKPFDMFPHTFHIENIAVLTR